MTSSSECLRILAEHGVTASREINGVCIIVLRDGSKLGIRSDIIDSLVTDGLIQDDAHGRDTPTQTGRDQIVGRPRVLSVDCLRMLATPGAEASLLASGDMLISTGHERLTVPYPLLLLLVQRGAVEEDGHGRYSITLYGRVELRHAAAA
jgi:hypothetical protein